MRLNWQLLLAIPICLALTLTCTGGERESGQELVVMLPPWFSPDESHPPLKRAFDEFRSSSQKDLILQFGPGKSLLLWQKILLMAREGHLPDVIMFKTSWTMDLVSRSIIRAIPSPLSKEVMNSANGALLDVVVLESEVWAVPYDMDVRLIHYRKDMIEEAWGIKPGNGWTFAEFLDLATKLTRDLDDNGKVDTWGFAAPAARSMSSVAQLLPWAWTMGATLRGDHDWTLNQKPLSDALALYAFFRDSVAISPFDIHVLEQSDVYQGFISGRFAMTEGGSWEIKMIENSSRFPGKLGVAPLPIIHGNEPITSTDGWAFGITTDNPAKKDAAVELLSSLFSADHQREKLTELGWLPVLEEGIPWVSEELGPEVAWSLKRCRSVPGGIGWTKVAMYIADALQEVLAGYVCPDEALLRVQKKLESGEK